MLRNRTVADMSVADEELGSWYDCLHRYDNYPSSNPVNNDPIIAIIDKIYRQKTIHFIRVDKVLHSFTL